VLSARLVLLRPNLFWLPTTTISMAINDGRATDHRAEVTENTRWTVHGEEVVVAIDRC
jgi:hypothetical protein